MSKEKYACLCWTKFALKFLLAVVSTLSSVAPAVAENSICTKREDRTKTIINTKAAWNGETLEVRFFNSAEDDHLPIKLVYTSYGQTHERWSGVNIMGYPDNSWNTVTFDLPEEPSSYRLVRVYSVCTESRPKTFFEKMQDALD